MEFHTQICKLAQSFQGERAVMQINVAQLLKAPIGSVRNYRVNEVFDIAGDGTGNKVQGEVKLMRANRGILVKGTLLTEVRITCGRCLSSFSCPLALDFEEEYLPTTEVLSGAWLALPEEPDCFTIDGHHALDLTEVIYQYALLVTPMKPLCHEGCAGLCPNCGRNLNLGLCDCPPKEIDPRWSELSKLASANDVSVNERKGTE